MFNKKRYNKEYRKNNKEKIRMLQKNWEKNNRNKVNKILRRYDRKYPEKKSARNYVYRTKQIRNECYVCGTNKDLHFHHTDYIKNEGMTLCRKHHQEIHRLLK